MESETLAKTLILITFCGFILYELFHYLRGKASEKWRAVPAKVLSTGTKTYLSEVGPNESKPVIKYAYRYDGHRYTGSRVKYGNIWAEKFTRPKVMLPRLTGGDEVEVFVNPTRPRQSVLYRGYEGNFLLNILILVGVLLVIVLAA